jgi:hypothetical protein
MASGHTWVATAATTQPLPYNKRLVEKLLTAIYSAFDQNDLRAAGLLLRILETVMERPTDNQSTRKRGREQFVAAYEHLWALRHPARGASDQRPSHH